jgi:hypothetical protein
MRGIKRESNHNPSPRVRDLPYHCCTGSTLVMDIDLQEEEVGPPGCRLMTTTGHGYAPTRG